VTSRRAVLRQAAAIEGEGGLHHVVEVAAVIDAVAFAHREIGGVVAADRAGVRLRGGLRLGGGAGLDRDDRLAGFECAGGRRHEGVGPPQPFDEQRDHFGIGIVDQEVRCRRDRC
jgi:hypothetical protein